MDDTVRKSLGELGATHGRVDVARETFNDLDALRARVTALKGEAGWACSTDRVHSQWTGGTLPDGHRPLSGELVLDARRSVHLRRHNGVWTLTTLTEHDEGDDVRFVESFLATEKGRTLRYHTWWRRVAEDGVGVWRPHVARFVGFGTEEGAP